jgi:hypothetical protein
LLLSLLPSLLSLSGLLLRMRMNVAESTLRLPLVFRLFMFCFLGYASTSDITNRRISQSIHRLVLI